ncbi:MAG: carboxypeptidase-like regulatory domain-containing protein [Candidatus Acidiferrum sp.]
MKCPRWMALAGAATILMGIAPIISTAQEAPPPPPVAPQTAPPAESSSSGKLKNQKYSHANDFLVTGTVFDPKGYAFPGVQLKIRRSTEKRFRWDDYTNSRGEFAVRVPQGSKYELVVRAKHFAEQTRDLDAKTGVSEARLVFRLEPEGGEKK